MNVIPGRLGKTDLVEAVVAAADIDRTEAAGIVKVIFEGMVRALQSGDRVELRGFGIFGIRKSGLSMNGLFDRGQHSCDRKTVLTHRWGDGSRSDAGRKLDRRVVVSARRKPAGVPSRGFIKRLVSITYGEAHGQNKPPTLVRRCAKCLFPP